MPVPTTAVTNEFLTAARGMGREKLDFAWCSTFWRECQESQK